MDTGATPGGDDLDLDAPMLRVRDAAMTVVAGSGTAPAAGEATARELDLIKVLEAQGEWNEQARQSLTALVECIRTLRDDWANVQSGLRQEIGQLSALVEQIRSAAAAPVTRPGSPARPAQRRRQVAVSSRAGKRRPAGGQRPRS